MNQNWTDILVMIGTVLVIYCLSVTSSYSAELKHKWKSPAFSGVGTSAHYLTIENQEFTRKKDIEAKKKSELAKLESEKKNTNYQKFLTNLESRIYAEFSKQLTDSMFGEACGTTFNSDGDAVAPTAGVVENGGATDCEGTMTFNGTTMHFIKDTDADEVRLTIEGPDGGQTITLPLNDFQF